MVFLDVGVRQCSSWRCWSSRWGLVGADAELYALLPRSSTVEVAASPPAVRLWPELAFQLHQAPDPGAVGADVGLDVGGRLLDGGQVDAEQLSAPLQRCRDRPALVRVVPGPHWSRVSNSCSGLDRECYRLLPVVVTEGMATRLRESGRRARRQPQSGAPSCDDRGGCPWRDGVGGPPMSCALRCGRPPGSAR